jgi:hypothetical protein
MPEDDFRSFRVSAAADDGFPFDLWLFPLSFIVEVE